MSLSLPRRRFLAAFAALPLVACTDQQPLEWKPETPAERELRESRERLQRTVGEGGLVGAGGGALLGAAVGGVSGAFRGAQIGRLTGATAGLYVKQIQSQYAEREAQANQILRDLRATNAELERSISAMRGVVSEKRQRARSQQVDSTRDTRVTQEAATLVQTAGDRDVFFSETRALVVKTGINSASSGIDAELQRLKTRVSTLRGISGELSSI